MKIENTFKNQLLGAWVQKQGIKVIANVRLSGKKSVPYALAGIPRQSTLAIGLHGCIKDKENRAEVKIEMQLLCDISEPKNLIIYGSNAYGVLDYPIEKGIQVHVFTPDTWRRSIDRKNHE